MKIIGYTVGTPLPKPNMAQTDPKKGDYVKNKESLDDRYYTEAEMDAKLDAKADASSIPTTLAQLSGDAEHRTITDAEKDIWNAKSDFSGSWNDLEDRPFGETTTTIGGDTLTWDGNTEGRASVMGIMYKVSDVILTLDDVPNGTIETFSDGYVETRDFAAMQSAVNTLGVVSGEGFWSFPTDNYDFMGQLVVPEAGIYFTHIEGNKSLTSLTIPGYTGFVSEQTVTTPLDEKYIPDTIARTEYVDTQVDALNKSKADAIHDHDDKYYTEAEIDAKFASIPTPDVSGQINAHNADPSAHSDIRDLIAAIDVPVESVNGKTGAVVLAASDVGALPSTTPLFSGDYNDLTNKPSIPSIEGLATVSYVDGKLANKAESDHNHNTVYYTKSEIDNMELITISDIDTICGSTIQMATASEVAF